jgi:hypothetical protein
MEAVVVSFPEPVLTDDEFRAQHGGWWDDHPYYLLIVARDDVGGFVEIDLGERGWLVKYADWMRRVSTWHLVEKEKGTIKLIMPVHQGEQPYYVARHVGIGGPAGSSEITAYGIGKKRKLNGRWVTERIWMMPDGTTCGGDDVDFLGIEIVKRGGPLGEA